jgi:formate-dependent phosphoribosylglycinamide formyltransferase (GAR transformylase)
MVNIVPSTEKAGIEEIDEAEAAQLTAARSRVRAAIVARTRQAHRTARYRHRQDGAENTTTFADEGLDFHVVGT